MSHIETQVIRAGFLPDSATGAIVTPIYQTSTYLHDALGVHKGYDYSRTSNPTRAALERCLAELEGGRQCVAFASGMAAIDTVMRLLKQATTRSSGRMFMAAHTVCSIVSGRGSG